VPTEPERKLALQLGVAISARVVINTARRFPYTFVSTLSRGLGVPLTAITSIIATNQATGLLGPVIAPLGDRRGYRAMMLAGLGLLAVGMISAGLYPIYVTVSISLVLAGLGKSVFDPALHAFVGQRVPFEHRGLAVGLTELSWAGSALLGIPIIGWLMDRAGWSSPFLVLGLLGLAGGILLIIVTRGGQHRALRGQRPVTAREVWLHLTRDRAAMGALGFGLLVGLANDNLSVVYGVWLESAFGLSVPMLGLATTSIGLAELLGESLTVLLSDRIGLRRALVAGLALSTLSYAVLPAMGQGLGLALVGLFLTFLTFEFTIVTAFSLFTELLPQARATMMASSLASINLGRVVGALVGAVVWQFGGMLATGAVSAVFSGLALVVLAWGMRGWSPQAEQENGHPT
jgi:DHA1 family inner membrane transport protein